MADLRFILSYYAGQQIIQFHVHQSPLLITHLGAAKVWIFPESKASDLKKVENKNPPEIRRDLTIMKAFIRF